MMDKNTSESIVEKIKDVLSHDFEGIFSNIAYKIILNDNSFAIDAAVSFSKEETDLQQKKEVLDTFVKLINGQFTNGFFHSPDPSVGKVYFKIENCKYAASDNQIFSYLLRSRIMYDIFGPGFSQIIDNGMSAEEAIEFCEEVCKKKIISLEIYQTPEE